MKKTTLTSILFFSIVFVFASCSGNKAKVNSPDNILSAEVTTNEAGNIRLSVRLGEKKILSDNRLGLVREDQDFSEGMQLISVSGIEKVEDSYTMLHGKQKDIHYSALKKVFHFKNKEGSLLDIIVQVSNDGVAFRYYFPEESGEVKTIVDEITTYRFPDNTHAWIQPMAVAKSGWERSNPSYEEDYVQNVRLDTLKKSGPGWIYPALFNVENTWVLISETAPYRDYCGTRLKHFSGTYNLEIDFPSQKETMNETSGANPNSVLPWYSPWRIITVGEKLNVIAESTIGTDLAKPNVLDDISFVKPGRSSWSWVGLKDGSIIYSVQKRFIDYSAEMNWEYCLIDVNWNKNIGYEKIKELADYAATKNVGLILWYNSAGSWNTTPYEPRNVMLTAESRDSEFARLKQMGIKGVKVDFFGGDGQDVMSYYLDIFESAAKHGIMVNTHGCTLPRGWQRTYPNLVTMESVKGQEFCTFFPEVTRNQPTHSCVLPFTRNAFDPMDFTPVWFRSMPFRHLNIEDARVTTNGFELALSVVFLSGIQHYAETDIGMQQVPGFIKQYLREIPVSWDKTKFIDGYPGKFYVVARKTGKTWFVAGINGENEDQLLYIDLSFINTVKGEIISDIDNRNVQLEEVELDESKTHVIDLLANGGFVMKFTEE